MSVISATRERTWGRTQRLKNDLIYAIVFVSLAIARRLPASTLRAMGRALGLLAWLVVRSERRRAIANVARAFPRASSRRRTRIARASFLELGALLGDTIALMDPHERVALSFAPGARALLDTARTHGRGIVLITAHLGPWERLAAALVEAGHPLTTPVRASYDPRLESLLHHPLRHDRGVTALDRDAPDTARALLRALRANEIAGFLVDLNTRVDSIALPFFGLDAWTSVAPARIALRTGAPVVAAFATRRGITITQLREASPPITGPIDDQVRTLLLSMTHAIERAISAEPTRWIWMHDRWGPRRPRTPLND